MFQQEAIKDFKRIYKKVFQEDLEDNEASLKARKILNLYKVIFGIKNSLKKEKKNQNYEK